MNLKHDKHGMLIQVRDGNEDMQLAKNMKEEDIIPVFSVTLLLRPDLLCHWL